MKFKKTLLAATLLVSLFTLPALTSCNNDDETPKYPETFTFRQILRVEQWNDGETNAFADFLGLNIHTNEPVNLQLPKEASITANGVKLTYSTPDPLDPGSYAYGKTIGGTPQSVTFVFTRRPGAVLTNTINLSNVPMIRLNPGAVIKNGEKYTYTSSLENPADVAITISLIAKDGTNKWYNAELRNNEYTFSNVPAGNYVLRSISTEHFDFLIEPNGSAGGERYASKVYQINNVKVE